MKRWFFVRGIGSLSKKYLKILSQSERLEFLAREFGRSFTDVLDERCFRVNK